MTADIQAIADELGLKKAGKQNGEIRYYDPYDNNTPDLYIDTDNERWYTFAQGQNKGGGYIDLIQHVNNCDETTAKEWLAENFNDHLDKDKKEHLNRRSKARNVLKTAATLANRQLNNNHTDIKNQIKDKRDFDNDTINETQIGYLNDTVITTLQSKYNDQALIDSGLFAKSDDGDLYCVLKKRITFPYSNGNEILYMAGRKTQDYQKAKYKKTRTTDYNRHILYQFRSGDNDTLIITEGFTDAISAWKAGHDVISPATVTFKDDDITKMRRIADQYQDVYIVNDADEAGKKGAKKTAVEMTKHGINPLFVKLDNGDDLDDWTTQNSYDITELLKEAESYINYLVTTVKKTGDAAEQVEAKNNLYEALNEWPQSQRRQVWERLNDPVPVLEHEMRQYIAQKRGERDYDYIDYTIPRRNGNGRKFSAAKLGEDILKDYDFAWIRDSKQFMIYENGYWRRGAESVIQNEVTERLGDEYKTGAQKNTVEWIKGQSLVERSNFQTVDDKVNVKNGVVDLKNGELMPHSPAYNFQFKIPWRFEPDAECPEIDSFLDEVTNGDETKKKKLYQLFGYVLIPDLIDEKAGVLVGSGSNGKTIVIELMKKLLGKMGNAYGNKSLKDIEGNNFATNFLFGKVANFDDDMPSTTLKRTGLFKKLTGGTDQGAEIKFGSQYNFKPYASMIFAANYLPKTEDQSNGFYRRWYIIHLPVDFIDNPSPDDPLQKQKQQKEELLNELTQPSEMRGLLNRAIKEAMELKEQGKFTHDRDWKEKREIWKRHSEPVTAFIKRFIKQGVSKTEAETRQDDVDTVADFNYDYIRKDCLYDMIRAYTQMISGEPVSKKDVKNALEESTLHLGIGAQPRQENRKRVVSGIKMVLPPKDEAAEQGVPPFLYQMKDKKYGDSNQSIVIDRGGSVKDSVLEAVAEHDGNSGAHLEDVIEYAADDGWSEDEVKQTLNDLLDAGTLYTPKAGLVKKL